MWTIIQRFISDEDGATAVEYCVMMALILLALITGLTAAGASTADWWINIRDQFTAHGM